MTEKCVFTENTVLSGFVTFGFYEGPGRGFCKKLFVIFVIFACFLGSSGPGSGVSGLDPGLAGARIRVIGARIRAPGVPPGMPGVASWPGRAWKAHFSPFCLNIESKQTYFRHF